MFTEIFRVKCGGRFRATTFCFLTVVFRVVVALLGVFSFTAILKGYLFPLFLYIRRTFYIVLVLGQVFSVFRWPFSFSIKSLRTFWCLIKPTPTPNTAIPSRNVFSARGLVTSSFCGSRTT